ncbi:MAG: arsenic efflux protein [Lachnospiraceae bacterium]|nr:arsenic efflux protein [Lachnospiraceae bacterium]
MIIDAFLDAVLDTARTLPFLLAAFLVIEAMEHYSGRAASRLLSRVGRFGPAAGAVFGCIPQCGFSVAAANLYSGGLISLGTLLAVFLSTSDEAVLILLGHPGSAGTIFPLLLAKVMLGIAAGYILDFFSRNPKEEKHIGDLCKSCGCSNTSGVWRPALWHTLRLAVYLLGFTFVLNLVLEFLGVEQLARILGRDTLLQPFLAALLGLIPNCASSVLVTELYLAGGLSFGSAVAGLSAGAGVGLAVLFRSNRPMKENFKILLLLYGIAAGFGILLGVSI